ncbi:MAG TPA: hypothetical protein VE988_04590 [Gemmataceae bacterium]|nr:hypothetical protein [Gemmataceae bacterium]
MAIATIACPKCSQTFRSSDDVIDTRIRCPLCGVAFVVEEFVSDDAPPIARAKPKAKSAEGEQDKNPYGVTDISIKARCPNCANEMASEDAIICLYCGYNTQTRTLGKTKKVVHQTGVDKAAWLWPGIGAVIGIFYLVLQQICFILWFGADAKGTNSTVLSLLFNEPIYIWTTLIVIAVIWKLGQFAFNRLILEPTPPEQEAG